MGATTSRITRSGQTASTRTFVQQYIANASIRYQAYWIISLIMIAAMIGMFSYIIWELRDKDKNFFEREDRNGQKYNAWIAGVLLTIQVILGLVTAGYGYKVLKTMETEDNYITDLVIRANLGNINQNMASSLQGLVRGRVGANINVTASTINVSTILNRIPILKSYVNGTGPFTVNMLKGFLQQIFNNSKNPASDHIDFGLLGGNFTTGGTLDLTDWKNNQLIKKEQNKVLAFLASVGAGAQDAENLEPTDIQVGGKLFQRSDVSADSGTLRNNFSANDRAAAVEFFNLIKDLNQDGITNRATFNQNITTGNLGWSSTGITINADGLSSFQISYYDLLAYNFNL